MHYKHCAGRNNNSIDRGVGAGFWLDEVLVCRMYGRMCTKNPENSGSG
jgi:hypothetical protein